MGPRLSKQGKTAALIVAPVLALALGIWSLFYLSSWQHSQELPGNYRSFVTRHFEVHYPDGYLDRAVAVVKAAEAFLRDGPRAFASRLGDLTPPERRIRLTLFASHEEFASFAQTTLSEDMSSNGGYFDALRLEIVLVLTADNIDSLGIRHEVAHLLVARGGGRFGTKMPRWLNEGLATWLETADLSEPGRSGPIVGWIKLVAAARGKSPTIGEILNFTDNDFRSADNDLAYAYSNLLVHFLVDIDEKPFFQFAKDVREGTYNGRAGLEHYFGAISRLDAMFVEYVRTLVKEFDRKYRDAILRGEEPPLR
jgi:hypothetical protein